MQTCVRVPLGFALRAEGQGRRALLGDREVPEARAAALRDAADLLLAEQKHPLYEAAARRIGVRALEELRNTPLVEIKKLIDALAHVQDNMYWYEAQCALRDVVGQLHRMPRLGVDFDSLEMKPRKGAGGGEPAERPEAEDDSLADLKAALPVAPADWYDGPLWVP